MKGSDRRERSFDTAESETLGMWENSMRENREALQTPTLDGGVGRSKKAKSRNVDMHVCRESDGLIVPTKRANKVNAYAVAAEFAEGRRENITIEYRFAEQKLERLPELAADLVRLKVDLIMVAGGTTPLAAKGATSTIPIVMATSADPVGAGLIANLARPGGNVTGLSGLSPELISKRLEILKDAIPRALTSWASAVAPGGVPRRPPTERDQACGYGTEAEIGRDRDSTRPQRFRERLSNRKAEAGQRDYDDYHSPLFRRTKADRGACRQIPVAGYLLPEKEFVDEGGLMSYGADYD